MLKFKRQKAAAMMICSSSISYISWTITEPASNSRGPCSRIQRSESIGTPRMIFTSSFFISSPLHLRDNSSLFRTHLLFCDFLLSQLYSLNKFSYTWLSDFPTNLSEKAKLVSCLFRRSLAWQALPQSGHKRIWVVWPTESNRVLVRKVCCGRGILWALWQSGEQIHSYFSSWCCVHVKVKISFLINAYTLLGPASVYPDGTARSIEELYGNDYLSHSMFVATSDISLWLTEFSGNSV